MKFLLPILSIIIGIYLGYNPKKNEISDSDNSVSVCANMQNELAKNEFNQKKSFCITKIPNKGDHFGLSEKQAESKIFRYFNESLKNYVRLNEHNVYTHDSGPGSSAQKYDPRIYNFVGFNVIDSDENLDSANCKSPSFKRLKNFKGEKIIEYLNKHGFSRIRINEIPKSYITTYVSHSFKSAQVNQLPWFQNMCNKKPSLLLTHCIANSKYDHQYEELEFDKDSSKLFANIFCKNSNQKSWKLISRVEI